MRWVLASGNEGKVREFNLLLADFDVEIVPQSDLGIEGAEETGLTFVENAILKARHAAAESGLPALADDSGIAIDYLSHKPGIYSARYAGENATDSDNIKLVLDQLADAEENQRAAQFHCVLVYLRHALDPCPVICHGQWYGRILKAPQGEGGFGYDPIFWVEQYQCSAAELSKEQKGSISHRGQAMKQLMQQIDLLKPAVMNQRK